MAVQVLLGGGSVRRLKFFAVIDEVGRMGVSMVVAAFAWYVFVTDIGLLSSH